MIKTIVYLWFCPIAFFWSWYFLSLNDLSFGMFFFSRELHDEVFRIYGDILDIDPQAIPGMVAKALAVDSLFVLALVLFRQRKAILGWWRQRQARLDQVPMAARSDDSLSSAP